ncbi:MAG: hypothetical protein V4677_08040 [Bacteroidota bacterium]
MTNDYRQEQPIFNNQFKLITEDNEFRMSLWVRGFGITDATGNIVLPLMGSFNLDEFAEAGNVLKVKFKIYPNGAKQYEVEIDPFNKTFVYNGQSFALKDFADSFKI